MVFVLKTNHLRRNLCNIFVLRFRQASYESLERLHYEYIGTEGIDTVKTGLAPHLFSLVQWDEPFESKVQSDGISAILSFNVSYQC